jgi:hypothetical protein
VRHRDVAGVEDFQPGLTCRAHRFMRRTFFAVDDDIGAAVHRVEVERADASGRSAVCCA